MTAVQEISIEDLVSKNISNGAQRLEHSSNVVEENQPKTPSQGEALSALQTVILYKQNQQTTQQWELQLLHKVEQELQRAIQDDMNQTTLDRWLL
ncbi:putative centromere binding protein b [Erysiphe neolycopersici]|uniref:Putative centromere binding protein b n=1 Tax=Erysiphe neolycopersici TaxID=212602 RepID=A0A420HR62_9PEZI|nr:putative centromere binding protein b [Erysiphe neolycopersici]